MQEKEIVKKLNKIRGYILAGNQKNAIKLIDDLKDELCIQRSNAEEYIDKLVKDLK